MTDPKANPGPFNGLPDFKPLADDLPPQMKAALVDLRKALTDPPSLGEKFPFVMPAQPAPSKAAGRPTTTQPNQVVRLARFIRLGDSIQVAAGKAGLKTSTARDILKGQCAIAHHPAVVAAGVELPAWARGNPHGNSKTARQATNASLAGVDAPPPQFDGAAASSPEPDPQPT